MHLSNGLIMKFSVNPIQGHVKLIYMMGPLVGVTIGGQRRPQGPVPTILPWIEMKDHQAHIVDGSFHWLCPSRVYILCLPLESTIVDEHSRGSRLGVGYGGLHQR